MIKFKRNLELDKKKKKNPNYLKRLISKNITHLLSLYGFLSICVFVKTYRNLRLTLDQKEMKFFLIKKK